VEVWQEGVVCEASGEGRKVWEVWQGEVKRGRGGVGGVVVGGSMWQRRR